MWVHDDRKVEAEYMKLRCGKIVFQWFKTWALIALGFELVNMFSDLAGVLMYVVGEAQNWRGGGECELDLKYVTWLEEALRMTSEIWALRWGEREDGGGLSGQVDDRESKLKMWKLGCYTNQVFELTHNEVMVKCTPVVPTLKKKLVNCYINLVFNLKKLPTLQRSWSIVYTWLTLSFLCSCYLAYFAWFVLPI